MPYPIEDKLVVAVASSALFDLTESNAVFFERGEEIVNDDSIEVECNPQLFIVGIVEVLRRKDTTTCWEVVQD